MFKKALVLLLVFAFMDSFGQDECLIAHYPLDGNALDNSINGFDGTDSLTTPTTDRFGNENAALKFHGNSFVELPSSVGNGIRTISLWFKLDEVIDTNITYPRSLFVRNSSNNSGEIALMFNSFGEYSKGTCHFGRRLGLNAESIDSDSNHWEMNIWHCLTAVIRPTEGMRMYIDGVLQADVEYSTAPSDNRNETLAIGRWGNESTRHFKGDIDDVRVYSCALSEAEISSICAENLNAVSTNAFSKDIAVYPNPSSDIIYIGPEFTEETNIEIYNLAGQMLRSETLVNGKILVADIPRGTYILMLHKRDGAAIHQSRIVIH